MITTFLARLCWRLKSEVKHDYVLVHIIKIKTFFVEIFVVCFRISAILHPRYGTLGFAYVVLKL